MKKLYNLILAAIISGSGLMAQPTFDFESGWTGNPLITPAYDVAKGWVSNNVLANSILGSNPISIYKTNDAHSGSFACELNTVALTNKPAWWGLQDTIGYMANGITVLSAPYIILGDTQTQRPATFEFWAKYTPSGTDTAYAAVLLQKRVSASQVDTIGAGIALVTGTVSAYTKYVMPIIYNSAHLGTNPDTMIIVFSSSGNLKPQVGSKLKVDDITFGFTTGITDFDKGISKTSIFPNPTSDEVNFKFGDEGVTGIKVYNFTGQLVGTYDVPDGKLKLSAHSFANGNYFFTAVGKNDELIDTGKFSILK